MSSKKNWEKVSSSFLLKVDPFYNKKINDCDGFVPTENVFFKRLFIEPSTINGSDLIDNAIRDKINSRTKNLVICVKGYAGCGKSVYIQKLMHDIYPKNNNFKNNTYNLKTKSIHRLEIGSGTSDNDIKSRYVDGLSISMAEGIKNDINIYNVFCEIIADNDDAIRFIDNKLVLHDKFIETDSIKCCLNGSFEELKKAIRIELKNYGTPLLFAIDCLWRIAYHATLKQKNKRSSNDSMFFICFDNLDAIDDVDMCQDFIKSMCNFRNGLDECLFLLDKEHKEYFIKTFTFVITCRNVTWGRLHLSELAEDDDWGDVSAHLCDYDISGFYEYTKIVQERINYYSSLAKDNKKAKKIINEMEIIKKLNGMLYVKERFKPLFNYNYRKCIDVITEISSQNYKLINEVINLAEIDVDTVDDGVYSGSSSIFFRLVFDYFKKYNLFDCNKMDLVTLDEPYDHDCNNRILTSQARILLMYLYNECKKDDGGRTRLDQIFEYFQNIYCLSDVCDTIYNLFVRNKAWRRPINFSDRPLKEHKEKEDLKNQMRIFEKSKKLDPLSFTKFEICKAGEEFIDFVVAHFEFYACRCSSKTIDLAPLFSNKSLSFIKKDNKYNFEVTCEAVLKAVENCCLKLNDFNEKVMIAKNIDLSKYLEEPIIKKTGHQNPQLHEERVIFCHIYHLEAFRFYAVNVYFKDKDKNIRADINKRLVNIISKYTELYGKYIMSVQRQKIMNVLLSKIKKIEESDYLDFITKISI